MCAGRWRARVVKGGCAAALLALLVAPRPAAADADALWYIVSEQCVPTSSSSIRRSRASWSTSARLRGPEGPCWRHAVPGDADRACQWHREPGDSRAGRTELLGCAWQARRFVEERVHHRDCRVTTSVWRSTRWTGARRTSCTSTSTACVPTFRQRCATMPAQSGRPGRQFPKAVGSRLHGHAIGQPDLANANPFVLLADGIPGARGDMAHYTLVVVGVS